MSIENEKKNYKNLKKSCCQSKRVVVLELLKQPKNQRSTLKASSRIYSILYIYELKEILNLKKILKTGLILF